MRPLSPVTSFGALIWDGPRRAGRARQCLAHPGQHRRPRIQHAQSRVRDRHATPPSRVYSGIQKFNNPYGTANQTGGWVIYKGATQSAWSSNALSFYLNGGPSPNNQYWSASFNTTNFGTDEVIQYYLYLTFDGVNGVQNTYLYGGDGSSLTIGQPGHGRRLTLYHPQPAGVAVPRQQPRRHGQCRRDHCDRQFLDPDRLPKQGRQPCAGRTTVAFITPPTAPTPAGSLGVGSGTTQVMPVHLRP